MVNFAWRWYILVKFCWFSTFSWYFIPQYLVNCCSGPYKTYYFLKEHDEVYGLKLIALIDLDLLLRAAQICKKCTIFVNLRTITQKGKKESRQMTPFFSSTFWGLTVCDIHFCIWKMSKFIFMWSPLRSIRACKIPEFWWWKLWDQNFVPFDSGNIQIEESKEPSFIFSIELRSKFVWSHNLLTLL